MSHCFDHFLLDEVSKRDSVPLMDISRSGYVACQIDDDRLYELDFFYNTKKSLLDLIMGKMANNVPHKRHCKIS